MQVSLKSTQSRQQGNASVWTQNGRALRDYIPPAAYTAPSTFHYAIVFTSQRFAFFSMYLYNKDERALLRNLRAMNFFVSVSPPS